MAHKVDDRATDKAKLKIHYFDGTRLLVVDAEGASNHLAESVRTLTQTVARGAMPNHALARPLPPKPMRPNTGLGGGDSQREQLEMDLPLPDPAEDVIDAVPEEEKAAPPSPSQKKERKPTSYEPIEIDCKTEVSLKAFCDAVKLETDSQKHLAIATWLKRHRATPEISAGLLLTCLRWMKWRVPNDITMPLRKLKQRNLFKAGSAPGLFAITHIGENEFDMLSGG